MSGTNCPFLFVIASPPMWFMCSRDLSPSNLLTFPPLSSILSVLHVQPFACVCECACVCGGGGE